LPSPPIGAVISAQFSLELDPRLGALPLSPGARVAVAQARGQTLDGVAPSRAGITIARAIQIASGHAFHTGIGICAALVAVGGVLALAAIGGTSPARRSLGAARCVLPAAGGFHAGSPPKRVIMDPEGP
jgi:hypothetical protein